jgi:hypothetical protein
MNPIEIVKEYFPDKPKSFLNHVLWEETGYPVFWNIPQDGNTPEECLRKQLQAFKDKIKEAPLTEDALLCSFCGKSGEEVETLLIGPNANICNECVEICNKTIADNEVSKTVRKVEIYKFKEFWGTDI